MKKCLDCVHQNSYMLSDKTLPEMFQNVLYMECTKYHHPIVGYDREGESGNCVGFEKRKEKI